MSTQHAQHPIDKAAQAEVKKEIHENQMHDPNQPLGNRVKAAAKVPGDKMEEVGHKNQAGVDHNQHVASGIPPVNAQHHGGAYPTSGINNPSHPSGVGANQCPVMNQQGVQHPSGVGAIPSSGVNHPDTHQHGVHNPSTTGVHNPTSGVNHPTSGINQQTHPSSSHHDQHGINQANQVPDAYPGMHPATAGVNHPGMEQQHGIHPTAGMNQPTSVHQHPSGVNAHISNVPHGNHPTVGTDHHDQKIKKSKATSPSGVTSTQAAPNVHGANPNAKLDYPVTEETLKKNHAEAKKEIHKAQAQDPDVPLGTRIKAAVKVPADKMQEVHHANKEKTALKK